MEIDEFDFPSFQPSVALIKEPEEKPKPTIVDVKPIIPKPTLAHKPVTITIVQETKTHTPKETSYQKFNELNFLFASHLGWTFTKKDYPAMGIPPLGYGAPYTDVHNASRKREEVALPTYTKDIAAIWDAFFYINKNNPTEFEFEILTNWNSVPNEKNPSETYNFMVADVDIYFNKMRRFIYDVPLGQVPLAFCLLFSYLNNEKIEHLENFFNLKVKSIEL